MWRASTLYEHESLTFGQTISRCCACTINSCIRTESAHSNPDISSGGSALGHKGVASIINSLGSSDFIRIRAGIGHPLSEESTQETNPEEVMEHELSDFTPGKRQILSQVIPLVSEAAVTIITEGVTAAMNKYN